MRDHCFAFLLQPPNPFRDTQFYIGIVVSEPTTHIAQYPFQFFIRATDEYIARTRIQTLYLHRCRLHTTALTYLVYFWYKFSLKIRTHMSFESFCCQFHSETTKCISSTEPGCSARVWDVDANRQLQHITFYSACNLFHAQSGYII